jgi:phosphate:Na+ symporter
MVSSLSFAMSCGGLLGMSAIGLLASVGGKYVARQVVRFLMMVTLFVCLPLLIFSQTGADISYEVAALFDNLDRRNVLSWGYTISCTIAALVIFVSAGPFSRFMHKTETNTNGRSGGMQPAAGYLDRRILTTPPIALEQARKEVQRMATVATWMYADVLAILSDFDARRVNTIRQHEQLLDSLNTEITSFLAALSKSASGPDILYEVPGLIQIVSALEHIGDVSEDILDCTLERKESGVVFSQEAMNDLISFAEQTGSILAKTEKFVLSGENYNREDLHHIKARTRLLYDQIKESHFSRICSGVCPPRSAILFQEMSSSCMRIAELCWNIMGIPFRRIE